MINNTKNISYYSFGKGSSSQLTKILQQRTNKPNKIFYFIDSFFQNNDLLDKVLDRKNKFIYYVNTVEEPKTTDIDCFVEKIKNREPKPEIIVGIGGGAVLDITKAVANMLTNIGKAEDYQGWDLIKNRAIYKIGIPTLSGTGAEASRTSVLTNVKKGIKLGMNSDYTMFDQLILDPNLTRTVPRNQFFYTGMDTYMHCMESLNGSYRNVIIDALASKALALCKEIFLSKDMMSEENLEKMMVASYLGGCSAGNVGIVHPFSAGLSVVLKLHHGIANCYAMSVLEEYYPLEFLEFQQMIEKQNVPLSKNVCDNLSDNEYNQLYNSSIIHDKPLTNALGTEFRNILTKEKTISLFKKM